MPGTTLGNSNQAETDIAAATITDLGVSITAKVRITGSGISIQSFGGAINRMRFIRFAGAVTLVHDVSALVLPGQVNITTIPGDTAIAFSDAAGVWTVYAFETFAEQITSTPDMIQIGATPHWISRNFKDLGAKEGDDNSLIAGNNNALAQLAASGKIYELPPGSLFKFGQGRSDFISGWGLSARGSTRSTLLMGSAAGQFDAADYTVPLNASNRALFYFQAIDDWELTGVRVRFETPISGTRSAFVFRAVDCARFHIDLEFENFREQNGGYCRIDSCYRDEWWLDHVIGQDCNPDSNTLPQGECAVVHIDDNRITVGGIVQNSLHHRIGRVGAFNVLPGTTWQAAYGARQSDCITMLGNATIDDFDIKIDEILSDHVGEVMDFAGVSGVKVGKIIAKNTHDSGVLKLWAGTRKVHIGYLESDGTALGTVAIAPSPTSALLNKNCEDIEVAIARLMNCSALTASEGYAGSERAAIDIENASDGSNKPTNIRFPDLVIEGYVDGGGSKKMPYGMLCPGVGPGVMARGPIRNANISELYPTANKVDWNDGTDHDVRDQTDPNKRLTFNIASIATGIQRTATWPNKDGTVAMLDDISGGGAPLGGLDDVDVPRNVELGGAAYIGVEDVWRWFFVSSASAVTLTANHNHRAYLITAAAVVTLPAASDCPDDWAVNLKARGGTITLNATGSDTIDGGATIGITTGNRALVMRTSATSFEVF